MRDESTLHKLSARLPAFALPFVTRSLRGHRGRRYVLLSLVLAGLSLFVSLWLALGTGELEVAVRHELGMEEPLDVRQWREFTVYVRDNDRLERAQRDVAAHRVDPHRPYETPEVEVLARRGRNTLLAVAHSRTVTPEQRELQARADALLEQPDASWVHEQGRDPATLSQVELVVARGGLPEVRRYRSPLGAKETLRFVALISGFILAGLATVIAPLLVAVQQAQERHENTLAPLLGTALRPRALALGLAAGPLAVVAIFAVPQALLFLAASVGIAELALGLTIVAVLASLGAGLVLLAQLVAHLIGRRRTSGVVGILLMASSGCVWLLGLALAIESHSDTATFPALLPHMGVSELLFATITGSSTLQTNLLVSIAASSLGAVVFGGLALRALARSFEARPIALLRAGEALVGTLTAIGLVNLAIDGRADPEMRVYLGLALLALPLTLLLMARVPAGDGPAKLRRVRVIRLLAEYGGWAGLHMMIASVIAFDPACWHPVALSWLAWCVVVLGLLAIRFAAVPSTVAHHVWAAFCALSLLMGFVQAVGWAVGEFDELGHLFVATELSPMLGLLQVALTAWIPISLVRHLGRTIGRLR